MWEPLAVLCYPRALSGVTSVPHPFLSHRCNEIDNRHPGVITGDSGSELKQLEVSRSG